MAGAGDQPHSVAIALHSEAVTVIFDFVEPPGAGGHGFADGGNAELEPGHGPEIGSRGLFLESKPERKTPPGGSPGEVFLKKYRVGLRHCGTITPRLATWMSPGHHTGRESSTNQRASQGSVSSNRGKCL
jgi:hypothetical protein